MKWTLHDSDHQPVAEIDLPEEIPDVLSYGDKIYFYDERNGYFREANVVLVFK